jgi:2-polyprenyl-3-methyl-5-hydroxy-6-metoxy-1,4-benzoquinol methylase
MDTDRVRWDRRHRGQPLPTPRRPEALDLVDDPDAVVPRSGRALDVACGRGAETLWLASRGLHVTALDVSVVAIEHTVAAATRDGLDDMIDARVHDLDGGVPDDPELFDLVICQRFRNHRHYPDLVHALRPGGIGMVTVLSAVGLDADPGPFHASPGELVDALTPLDVDIRASTEGSGLASIVFRRRRP